MITPSRFNFPEKLPKTGISLINIYDNFEQDNLRTIKIVNLVKMKVFSGIGSCTD